MFTGIIEGLGTIRRMRAAGAGKRLTLESDFTLDGTKIGDSIAVNGACLTAVRIGGRQFDVDVSPETLSSTTLAGASVGDRVNLERAMRISDRLDGHLVSGHVDGIGTLDHLAATGNAVVMRFAVEAGLSRYMVRKGSVAVDGISLTINACDAGSFTVSVIPHTAAVTTLGLRKPGDRFNIETDMIGKYVERFISPGRGEDSGEKTGSPAIDAAFLRRTGFM